MSRDDVLAAVTRWVAYARRCCPDVEFSAEDATRTDRDFLARVVSAAIAAGATTINIADTVGYAMPSEIAQTIRFLRDSVRQADAVAFSVHTHDDLGMALANALSAVAAGATQVECTVNGIGERAGNCALEVVMSLRTRSDYYQCETRFEPAAIARLSRLVAKRHRYAGAKK